MVGIWLICRIIITVKYVFWCRWCLALLISISKVPMVCWSWKLSTTSFANRESTSIDMQCAPASQKDPCRSWRSRISSDLWRMLVRLGWRLPYIALIKETSRNQNHAALSSTHPKRKLCRRRWGLDVSPKTTHNFSTLACSQISKHLSRYQQVILCDIVHFIVGMLLDLGRLDLWLRLVPVSTWPKFAMLWTSKSVGVWGSSTLILSMLLIFLALYCITYNGWV